jgi:hypothetical protein
VTNVPLLALLLLLVLAAPAGAVVGGDPFPPSKAPWFAATGICGGTLIAPDRVATAAHCLDPIDFADLESVKVGGQVRRGVRVALPSTWETRRAGFALHDIAIVQLDRPVKGVEPAVVAGAGSAVPERVTVVGRGQIHAPAPGRRAASGLFPIRRASLRSVGDADCNRRWKRSRTKYRDRYAAATDVCAIGAGRPQASVCAGDSGGPLITGTLARPVLLGVISWTGPRCGADGLPSVAVDVRAFRDFLLDPTPAWAPVPSGPARVTGDPRVGATLTCELPAWDVAPARVEVRWVRRVRTGRRFRLVRVGKGTTYTARSADSGHLLDCEALGVGPGGRTLVPLAPGSAVRIS